LRYVILGSFIITKKRTHEKTAHLYNPDAASQQYFSEWTKQVEMKIAIFIL